MIPPHTHTHTNTAHVFCCQVSGEKEFFAQMVVDAVSKLDPQTLDLKMIGIKKVRGVMGVCTCMCVYGGVHV